MLRISILLAAIGSAIALPSAAEAAVVPFVSGSTLSVAGDGAADQITVRAPSPTTLQVNDFTFDRSAISTIEIRSGGGDDVVRIADALTETVTIESGAGADTVLGGPGRETIAAGDDNDTVHAGAGDDAVLLGNGDDTALQGDGFDVLDGQAGNDKLRAVGTSESEEFTVQAVGATARITRDTGPAATDGASIESLDVTAAGGPDLVDVGDLSPRGSSASPPTSASRTARATRSRFRAATGSTTSPYGRSSTPSASTASAPPWRSRTPSQATTT